MVIIVGLLLALALAVTVAMVVEAVAIFKAEENKHNRRSKRK